MRTKPLATPVPEYLILPRSIHRQFDLVRRMATPSGFYGLIDYITDKLNHCARVT
jgi:hypothetical protein